MRQWMIDAAKEIVETSNGGWSNPADYYKVQEIAKIICDWFNTDYSPGCNHDWQYTWLTDDLEGFRCANEDCHAESVEIYE